MPSETPIDKFSSVNYIVWYKDYNYLKIIYAFMNLAYHPAAIFTYFTFLTFPEWDLCFSYIKCACACVCVLACACVRVIPSAICLKMFGGFLLIVAL